MLVIDFPEPDFRIKKEEGKDWIFDRIRKKWLVLTPEEWVRQNFVQFLVRRRNYPPTLIALEKEISLGELTKRFDILVYDPQLQPWMIIECKEMQVKLDQSVLQQALRYNISVPVPYIVITNGTNTHGWKKAGPLLEDLTELPPFPA